MLSKNRIKYINSLKNKKFRQLHQSFVVEGAKSVLELLDSGFEIESVLVTKEFLQKYSSISTRHSKVIETVTPQELEAVGSFQTNDSCLAVARTLENAFLSPENQEYVLVLDDVRDPGNLGTIIRIADWYGISKIVCSDETTDFYNPKVIAASKGSFTRVRLFYTHLADYFSKYPEKPKMGAFLGGTSLYDFQFPAGGGFIVMGNESNGITDEVAELIGHRITIPRVGEAESLNAGIATAVILDNLQRQIQTRK